MTTQVNYQTSRNDALIDKMDVSLDKDAIKSSVRNGMHEMQVMFEDEAWTYNARMNMSGYVNYWYSNANWIRSQYDKTVQKIRDLAASENGTEIHMEQVDKLVYIKKMQEVSLERAELYYTESKAFYEMVTQEKYMPYNNKKVKAKDVTTEYKLSVLQNELKNVKK